MSTYACLSRLSGRFRYMALFLLMSICKPPISEHIPCKHLAQGVRIELTLPLSYLCADQLIADINTILEYMLVFPSCQNILCQNRIYQSSIFSYRFDPLGVPVSYVWTFTIYHRERSNLSPSSGNDQRKSVYNANSWTRTNK